MSASPVAATRDELHGVHLASPVTPHVCVIVDATLGARLEVDRVAGWIGSPVVSLSETGHQEEERPLLRLRFHASDTRPGRAFPSAAGQVVAVAFDGVSIVPNQPETGTLRLCVGEELPRDLPKGSAVAIRLLSGHLQVEAAPPSGERSTWIASSAALEPTSGVHMVHRDGLLVADLDSRLTVTADPVGFVRHRV